MPRLRIRYQVENAASPLMSGEGISPRKVFRSITLLISVCCFGWAAGDWMVRQEFQEKSQLAFDEAVHAASEPPAAYPLASEVEATEPAPSAQGQLVAKLVIPRLKVSGFVQEGFDANTLSRAIGHYPASAKPGARGNVVLAAHRDTFFAGLRDARSGDDIVVQDIVGNRWVYRVNKISVVDRTDSSAMANPEDDSRKLTLITCYPFSYVGPAPERLVVQAELVKSQLQRTASNPPSSRLVRSMPVKQLESQTTRRSS